MALIHCLQNSLKEQELVYNYLRMLGKNVLIIGASVSENVCDHSKSGLEKQTIRFINN